MKAGAWDATDPRTVEDALDQVEETRRRLVEAEAGAAHWRRAHMEAVVRWAILRNDQPQEVK